MLTSFSAYAFGLQVAVRNLGLASVRQLGLRKTLGKLFQPIDYSRFEEFTLTLRGLDVRDSDRLLDISSPKLFALWLTSERRCAVTATDIMPSVAQEWQAISERLRAARRLAGELRLETEDARALSYPAETFDRVFSISVLEHIEGTGDTAAVREALRVLKPGGLFAFTVPFGLRYEEQFVRHDVYGHQYLGTPLFFQRVYDPVALQERLLDIGSCEIVARHYIGERRVQFSRYWYRLSDNLRGLLGPLNYPASMLFRWHSSDLRDFDGPGHYVSDVSVVVRKGSRP